MSFARLLGLLVVGSSLAACSTPERAFVADDGGATDGVADTLDLDAVEAAPPVDCTGKADGTTCGEGQICLKNECHTSACGDGFLNKAGGEDCEDGNDESGDGCSACKFDCKVDTDCKSENVCLTSRCDLSDPTKGLCKGSPAADGTACKDAMGADGKCKAGACQKIGCGDGTVGGDEECDDGNSDDSDGCKSDCKWSCKADADCDDGDACTGKETCDTATHKCAAGTAVTCTASASCTGTCDKTTGACVYPDVDKDGVACDKDCNDADPAMFPGAFECKDGKDNDCNDATADSTAPSCLCYADSDKDGYALSGAASIVSTAATCPDGHTRRTPVATDTKTLDCREGNASVFPGQTTYFTTTYCNGKSFFDPVSGKLVCSAQSWDYDCDGVATKQYGYTSTGCTKLCLGGGGICFCSGVGWSGTTVPECGVTASFRSCTLSGGVCLASIANRTQACK